MSVQTEPVWTDNQSLEQIYAEVLQFYAQHMRFLDEGDAEAWAQAFTEDGSFAPPSLQEPVRGRATLAASARRAKAELAESGEVHRHLLSMADVRPRADGSLEVRSYVQVIATARGGQPRLHLMTTCHDILVREAGELRVRERRVTRDDKP